MATKYKIGDKVVLTSVDGVDKSFGLRVGMEGTIKELYPFELANVSFKGWNRGHTNKEYNFWIVELER